MEQLKEIIRDNWIEILLLVLGYLFGFVTSYLKERVKNKALLADINALEEEKKIHHLDIEKRKYKYEDKRAQFTKYFNLIDNMAVVSNEELITKFLPLITTYQEEFLGANEDRDKEVAALNKFSKGIGEFTFKSNDNIMRIRTETNGIRLAASNRTLELMGEMDTLLDKQHEMAIQFANKMTQVILSNNQEELKKEQSELNGLNDQIKELKESIIEQIRVELDEI